MNNASRWKHLGHLFWVAATAVPILLATLPASGPADPSGFSGCLVCGETGTADAVRNLMLFAPLGAALVASGASFVRALLLGALFSAFIEYAQLLIPGRDASLGDVLFNGVGAGLGAIVWSNASRWWPRSARIALIALSVTGGTFAGTAWLLKPAIPSGVFYAQWAPRLGHLELYRGRVLEASIGNIAIPSAQLTDSPGIWLLLQQGTDIRITAIAGPPVSRLSALLRVVDAHQREMVLIGPDRTDFVYQYRTRATALRLETPALRIRNAFATVREGDTLRIGAGRSDAGTCLTLGSTSKCPMRFSVGSGWALFVYPRLVRTRLEPALNVAWIFVLCFVVGFWAPGFRTAAAQAAVLVAVALVVNIASSIAGASAWDIASVVIGVATGALARPMSTPRHPAKTANARTSASTQKPSFP